MDVVVHERKECKKKSKLDCVLQSKDKELYHKVMNIVLDI